MTHEKLNNIQLTALIFKPTKAKNRNSKPEGTFSLISHHDSYPKDKHHQIAKGAAENKPNSLKLSKSFNQKIKPKLFNSIFNNQEEKLNIHQVKKKHKESLKKL